MCRKSRILLLFTIFLVLATGCLAQPQGSAPAAGHSHDDHMKMTFDPSKNTGFDDPKRAEWQKPDEVIAALGLKPGMKVADIGAGTGYFVVRLARHATKPQVFAVDIEPKMLDHIQQRGSKEGLSNITTVLASENSANLPEAVDLVLMVNTYHHVPARSDYFAALLPKLAPGGRVAIIDYRPEIDGGPPKHFRFSARQIQQEMAKAGYRVLDGHGFLPRQTFQVFGAKSK